MGNVYENPPLIEAICEFRFQSAQPWDWTIPGLVYDKIKAEFPKKRQQDVMEVEVKLNPQNPTQEVKSGIARMQFLREDERALIQVGPDLLAINHLKPYSNWSNFKKMIVSSLNVFREIAQPKGFQRIGLRYINRLDVPESDIRIEDYLLAVPNIPEPIPQLFATWVQRVEIPFEQSNGILVLQSGNQLQPAQTAIVMILDLDFVTLSPDLIAVDGAMDWVELAHNEVEKTFEACITAKARELFGATKEMIQND